MRRDGLVVYRVKDSPEELMDPAHQVRPYSKATVQHGGLARRRLMCRGSVARADPGRRAEAAVERHLCDGELWWIGVTPAWQGRGVGGRLHELVEAHVRSCGGRILLVATSSLPALERTRRFYARRHYDEAGRIPDFYGEGDSKVVFVKRLARRSLADASTGTRDP